MFLLTVSRVYLRHSFATFARLSLIALSVRVGSHIYSILTGLLAFKPTHIYCQRLIDCVREHTRIHTNPQSTSHTELSVTKLQVFSHWDKAGRWSMSVCVHVTDIG